MNGKQITTDHPVTFVSGLFRGSQLNWAALTKEAFAIYVCVKKLILLNRCTDSVEKCPQTIGEVLTQEYTELKSEQLGNGTGSIQHPV